MGRLFGTDGIRGIAGRELTPQIGYRLGLAVSTVLRTSDGRKCSVVIGKDTRQSGDLFEAALCAGLCASGSDAWLLGVTTTPAVAYLVRELKADAGIMISASHNPAEYNGLKVFGAQGYKLSDALEEEAEKIILGEEEVSPAEGAEIGRVYDRSDACGLYIEHIAQILRGACPKEGLKVLFDLSNGSASVTAKKIFHEGNLKGLKADFLSDSPDGMNVNLGCGSTHIGALAEKVKNDGYDIGFAFDGDADRCLAVDENGTLIDGDMLIAALADDMKARGTLRGNTAVVTKLTNLGFHLFCKERGIEVAVTDVGDRCVLEEMLRSGANIGGEQSGHIILTDHATTGDGQTTACAALRMLLSPAYRGKKASEVFGRMKSLPQVSVNVKIGQEQKKSIPKDLEVVKKTEEITARLHGRGRVLLRPSGTEALIRIMLEGDDVDEIGALAGELAEMIRKKCGQN